MVAHGSDRQSQEDATTQGAGLRPKMDMRIRKTRHAICEALERLMTERDISQISVKDVADTALINKKTFYAHYDSVYAVLDEMESTVVEALGETMEKFDLLRDRHALRSIFRRLTTLIDSDERFYAPLLQSETYGHLKDRIETTLREKLLESLEQATAERDKLDYAVDYVAAGITANYRQWLSSGRRIPLDDMADMASTFARNSLVSFGFSESGSN